MQVSMMRLVLAVFVFVMVSASARAACHAQAGYSVCEFDTGTNKITLFDLDAAGQPYGGFASLQGALAAQGQQLIFAMNAGMYGEDLKPIGLMLKVGNASIN